MYSISCGLSTFVHCWYTTRVFAVDFQFVVDLFSSIMSLKSGARSCNFLTDTANYKQNSNWHLQIFDRENYACSEFWFCPSFSPKWGFLTPKFCPFWTTIFQRKVDFLTIFLTTKNLLGATAPVCPATTPLDLFYKTLEYNDFTTVRNKWSRGLTLWIVDCGSLTRRWQTCWKWRCSCW